MAYTVHGEKKSRFQTRFESWVIVTTGGYRDLVKWTNKYRFWLATKLNPSSHVALTAMLLQNRHTYTYTHTHTVQTNIHATCDPLNFFCNFARSMGKKRAAKANNKKKNKNRWQIGTHTHTMTTSYIIYAEWIGSHFCSHNIFEGTQSILSVLIMTFVHSDDVRSDERDEAIFRL